MSIDTRDYKQVLICVHYAYTHTSPQRLGPVVMDLCIPGDLRSGQDVYTATLPYRCRLLAGPVGEAKGLMNPRLSAGMC